MRATGSPSPMNVSRRVAALVGLVSLLAASGAADAQASPAGALVSGRVVDSLDRPIAGAEALLVGTDFRALTSEHGTFAIASVPVGRYRLLVRRVGYEPVTMNAAVAGPDTLETEVVLHRTVRTLDSVAVTATATRWDLADFETNRKLGVGTFFSPEEIDRHAGSVVHTMLRTKLAALRVRERPCGGVALVAGSASTQVSRLDMGVRVVGTGNGCPMPDLCYVQLYVDGRRIFGTDHVTEPPNIDELGLEQLAAVEVYTSGAATPARYNGLGAVCGTVVLWRRR